MVASHRGQPLPLDYDRNPDRFRTGRLVVEEFGLAGDVHAPLAARLVREACSPILDVGCGDGVLGRLLLESQLYWIGVDLSRVLLRDAPRPRVLCARGPAEHHRDDMHDRAADLVQVGTRQMCKHRGRETFALTHQAKQEMRRRAT